MGFLVSIFFLVLFFALLIIVFVLGFLRSIFRFGRGKSTTPFSNQNSTYETQKQHKKIFDKNEGEYADFEELPKSK